MSLWLFLLITYVCTVVGLRINGTPWGVAAVAGGPGVVFMCALVAALGV